MFKVLGQFGPVQHVQFKVQPDVRGSFTKLFHHAEFLKAGWPTNWAEAYVSVSLPRVIRGLHFQVPPFEHAKLVVVLAGEVSDGVVDLRRQEKTYGQHQLFSLEVGQAVFIPAGFAHGFFVSGAAATLLYLTTSTYDAAHDRGILWSSLEIDWPVENTIISERDRAFEPFSNFQSPF